MLEITPVASDEDAADSQCHGSNTQILRANANPLCSQCRKVVRGVLAIVKNIDKYEVDHRPVQTRIGGNESLWGRCPADESQPATQWLFHGHDGDKDASGRDASQTLYDCRISPLMQGDMSR